MMMVAYLVGSLLVFLSPKVVGGESVCAASDNEDTNSMLECKYLSPCTAGVVPEAPDGYSIECETMPCDADQDIMRGPAKPR